LKLTTRLFLYFEEIVNAGLLVVTVVVFLLFTVFILPYMSERLAEMTGVTISPDTSFLYSAGDLYAMAESYGDTGRAYYIMQKYTFDILWPVVYLLFFLVVLTYIFRYTGMSRFAHTVKLLPVYAFLFDLLENLAAAVVMYRYPRPTAVLAHVTSLFSIAKWLLIVLSVAVVAAGLVLCLKKRIGRA